MKLSASFTSRVLHVPAFLFLFWKSDAEWYRSWKSVSRRFENLQRRLAASGSTDNNAPPVTGGILLTKRAHISSSFPPICSPTYSRTANSRKCRLEIMASFRRISTRMNVFKIARPRRNWRKGQNNCDGRVVFVALLDRSREKLSCILRDRFV